MRVKSPLKVTRAFMLIRMHWFTVAFMRKMPRIFIFSATAFLMIAVKEESVTIAMNPTPTEI